MFKHLFRSNRALGIGRIVTVNAYSIRNKSTEDLKKAFADTFDYIFRRTKMDIDKKMKELADMFAKTTKELADLVKKNEQFIRDEAQRVEEAVRKSSEVCAKGKMDRLRQVKEEYANRIKICNERASKGLSAAKVKCDQHIETADALMGEMKKILKECLDTNDFVKCVASETKEATKQRKQIAQELNGAVKNAETSVTEQLKEAAKCYADAKAEALQRLQKILKETKDCVE